LLSSSLWEGVDLKDDLSRFQIIAKAPYPMLSETRTKIKMQKFPLWYKAQTIMKLLQGFGRSIRDKNDWADTYVLDSAAHELLLYKENRKMVPHAYHDIIFPSSFKEFLG
jgi:Rad3-related DNA helicases|tara:strand:- start:400 stop:729 length:330 start_codon:yes stop_codon:yes gene_type:complete